MTALARTATLGLVKEATAGTWLAPTVGIPFTKADYEDMYVEIKDESVRGDDTVLHGMYQGPGHCEWNIDVLAYPDLIGHFLRATIGPDTVTAATSTTLSAATTIGATSIQTPVSLPAGTTIMIDTGPNLEYAWTDGAATGVGPYTSNVTTVLGKTGTNRVGLLYAHNSAVAVVTATTHTFKQNPAVALPTYSLTVYDTNATFSGSYARASELQLKIDPKGALAFTVKFLSFPTVSQTLQTETYTTYDPLLGWSWAMTNGGASSTRGLTLDATIKRATEAIASSDGLQTPREVFAGALEIDGTYKAIFESQTDMNLFLNYTQTATTAALQQPIVRGGQSLSLTMSKSGYFKGKRDFSTAYTSADFSLSGIYNTTDGGAISAVLSNWSTAAY